MKQPPTISRDKARGGNGLGGRRARDLLPNARLSGPMPWVIAIMVAMVVIACAAALALGQVLRTTNAELRDGATVQILQSVKTEREQQAAAAARILSSSRAVASHNRISDQQLVQLLEPWLGSGDVNEIVPIPAMYDVRLRGAVTDNEIAELQSALKRAAPDMRFDRQASWLAPVFDTLLSLRILAMIAVGLLTAIGVTAVWLSSRSALSINRETIDLVHLLGGTNRQVARIFERAMGIDAFIGSIVGAGLGVATIVILQRQFDAMGLSGFSAAGFDWQSWAILSAVPLCAIIIAVITARVTVLGVLRRML